MRTLTNSKNIDLPLAVFLATDNYDYDPDTISATALIKPIKKRIMSGRNMADGFTPDIGDFVASRIGSAVHDSIEMAWEKNYRPAMEALGYPEKVIDRVRVNPTLDTVNHPDGNIDIYMEKRTVREFMGYKVSGKFDFAFDGQVQDHKSTKVFYYTNGVNTEDYILQGSIYRWLNPELLTNDFIRVHYIFTDYMAGKVRQDTNYPKSAVISESYPLLSLEETEAYILGKIREHEKYQSLPQDQLPPCTDEDLWRKPPVWKFYANPDKKVRSTKNFDNSADAYAHKAKAGKGVVDEVKGEVVACKYCAGFSGCDQKDIYLEEGTLIL